MNLMFLTFLGMHRFRAHEFQEKIIIIWTVIIYLFNNHYFFLLVYFWCQGTHNTNTLVLFADHSLQVKLFRVKTCSQLAVVLLFCGELRTSAHMHVYACVCMHTHTHISTNIAHMQCWLNTQSPSLCEDKYLHKQAQMSYCDFHLTKKQTELIT